MRLTIDQVELPHELGFLLAAILGLVLISNLMQTSHVHKTDELMMMNEDRFVLNTITYNIIGSIFLGLGIGLYKRIANADRQPAPRYCTVHVFFLSVLALTVTPYFKFPSVAL